MTTCLKLNVTLFKVQIVVRGLLKNNLKELNIDTLKVSYWIKKIDEKKLDSFQEKLIIKDDEDSLRRTLSKYDKKIKSEQKIKKFKTVNRRIYSKLFK